MVRRVSRGAARAPDPSRRLSALLPAIAGRAAAHDGAEEFVAPSYDEMKAARLMGLAVPRELGGDGMALRPLAADLRRLAGACPATALAFAMHSQAAAVLGWHWRHHGAPVAAILRRIARDQLVVATTAGSDWLAGSGVATRVEGGYRITATKPLVSGAPACDLLATSAIHDDPRAGPTVLHFIVRMDRPPISVRHSWRAMGMRGTGSHHVEIDGLVLSDRAIILRRPAGRWHPFHHAGVMIAVPLIFSVYLGIAEAARDAAVAAAAARPLSPSEIERIGAIEGHLNGARVAVEDMLAAATPAPDIHSTNRIMLDRTLAGRAAIATVEAACEFVGGAAYLRPHPLERLFRDVQAARFHPLGAARQERLAGRIALGLPGDEAAPDQASE